MTQKTAKDAMTPISETISLDINAKLDLYKFKLVVYLCVILKYMILMLLLSS